MKEKAFCGMGMLVVAGLMVVALGSWSALPTVYMADNVCQYVGHMADDGQEAISACETIDLERDRYHTDEVAPAEFVSRLHQERLRERFEEKVRKGEYIPTVGE
jgi:hypothetical protein